jgi:hypothetical protein
MAQFKTVLLPFYIESDNYVMREWTLYSPINDSETQKAEAEIQELIKEGWKIVSTSELLGALSNIDKYKGESIYCVTKGILVFMVKE